MQNFPGPGTKTAVLTLKPYTGSSLLVTSYCALHIISAERVGQGCAGWHARGVSAGRLGCQSAMFGTGWTDSCPGCMDKFRKCYSHFVRGSFLSGKAAWAPERVFNNESPDYYMLVYEWAWLVYEAGSGLGFILDSSLDRNGDMWLLHMLRGSKWCHDM